MAVRKKKTNPTSRSFWVVIAALALFALIYSFRDGNLPFFTITDFPVLPLPNENEIRVSFLDVGQGDSILIQTKDNSVLIDAGDSASRGLVTQYLREAGVTKLDYLILTHPHSDHIGSADAVLEKFKVNEIIMPDEVSKTTTFERLLSAIEKSQTAVTVPEPGDLIKAGLIELRVLAPEPGPYADINESSIVVRMLYGDTAFLFSGDAEFDSEYKILDRGLPVRANVLKIGHHGSDTSSSDRYLDAVKPAAAIISCGKNNAYGHPSPNLISRLEARETAVYRTDENGLIVMITDGTIISLYLKE